MPSNDVDGRDHHIQCATELSFLSISERLFAHLKDTLS